MPAAGCCRLLQIIDISAKLTDKQKIEAEHYDDKLVGGGRMGQGVGIVFFRSVQHLQALQLWAAL